MDEKKSPGRLINQNSEYLRAIYHDVLCGAGLPEPSFETDRRGKLVRQFDESAYESFMGYYWHLAKKTNYFKGTFASYLETNGLPDMGTGRRSKAQLAWTLATVAVGEERLRSFDNSVKGCLAQDVRYLGIYHDYYEKGHLAPSLVSLDHIGIIDVAQDPYETLVRRNGERVPKLRYRLATELSPKEPVVMSSFNMESETITADVPLDPGLGPVYCQISSARE